MNKQKLDILICPECSQSLVEAAEAPDASVLRCAAGHTYPVVSGIPRFVPPDNYADSFGYQWRTYNQIQLDSSNGTTFSAERFRTITEWTPAELSGKLVLDAGCGAGRFAEVALNQYHADLVACDLSAAVDVCQENLAQYGPLVCQASIFQLPFRAAAFDFVYCIGVIQHTPDPLAAIRALGRMVKPGGQIGLWIYERDWKSYLGTVGFKYILRPFIKRRPREAQIAFCQRLLRMFGPMAWWLKTRGLPGKIVMRLLPVASAHLQDVPLSRADFDTWVLLDTFDMYSPAYDSPQRYERIASFLTELGFSAVRRHPHGGIAITATRTA